MLCINISGKFLTNEKNKTDPFFFILIPRFMEVIQILVFGHSTITKDSNLGSWKTKGSSLSVTGARTSPCDYMAVVMSFLFTTCEVSAM